MDWKNPEERREYYHKYYEANKEKRKEQQRQYYNTPRGRARTMANNLMRADREAGRGECTLTPEWILKNIFNSECIYCGATGWENLGCDRIDNDLPHTPENVVCSCWDCNNKRGAVPFAVFVQRLQDAEPLLNRNDPKQSKPLMACNPETLEIIYEFPSTAEAGRNGFHPGTISKACNGRFGRKKNSHKYKGLLWFYK